MISSRAFPFVAGILQTAFVDISGILKKDLERIKVFHDAVNLTAVCYSSLEASSAAAFSTSSTTTGASSASEDFLSFFGITFFGASSSTVSVFSSRLADGLVTEDGSSTLAALKI